MKVWIVMSGEDVDSVYSNVNAAADEIKSWHESDANGPGYNHSWELSEPNDSWPYWRLTYNYEYIDPSGDTSRDRKTTFRWDIQAFEVRDVGGDKDASCA